MPDPTRSPISTGDRLLQVLRDRCADVATSGAKFPTEPRLAEELGVSRPMLREALSRLEHEGLLRRRRGETTSVNAAATGILFWFDRQETFADLLQRSGYVVEQHLLSFGFEPAGPQDIEALGVDAGSWMVVTRKRWRADGRVVIVADNFVPVPPAIDRLEIADPQQSMFHLVTELYGEEPEWEIARPAAVITDEELARHFELARPEAVLALRLLGVAVSGARLYRSVEYHVSGGLDWSFVRTFRPRG